MAIPKKTFQFKIVLVLKVFNILHNPHPKIFRPKHRRMIKYKTTKP